jgi:hypothetical protein
VLSLGLGNSSLLTHTNTHTHTPVYTHAVVEISCITKSWESKPHTSQSYHEVHL